MQHQRQASDQRSCFPGLEIKSELIWEDWDPGKEYTKKLVIQNTYMKLRKLHIRPPASKYFSASIPQIVLSPGISFSLPITFSPLQMCEYEDSIELEDNKGSYKVCLRAIIPRPKLEVPDRVSLPLCAVQHSSQDNFLLQNVSKRQAFFIWESAAPFQLRPDQGLLKPGQECRITVVFQPQEARVYQQQVCCRFGEGDKADDSCTVLLYGQATNPYLQLRLPKSKAWDDQKNPELHFGSVAVGQRSHKHFEIFNPSHVNVSFSLSRAPGLVAMFGPDFRCDITSAEVGPGGSLQAKATFSPTVVDTVSVEYLSLKYGGALSESQLKLTGKCVGPSVSLSSSVLDFGCGKEGQAVVQTVQLLNSSHVQAIYQWDIDCENSVFSILPASGTVLPHSHIKLKAVYNPTHPMAHYRRVTCLILHRDPLFLDLIGTCHSESQKPEVLKPEHLDLDKRYCYHRENSQDSASQQNQNEHVDQHGADLCKEKTNQNPNCADVISPTPLEESDEFIMDCPAPTPLSPFPCVSMVPNELLFNHIMIPSSSSSAFTQVVTIQSQARGKLSLVWTVAKDSPFSVTPTSCDVAPLMSTEFRVTYKPKQLNTLHGGQLECFAFYKDGSDKLCPPCCVTLRIIGHSFQQEKQHFTPSCAFDPPRVVFRARGVVSYRNVLLHNNNDLPLSFWLDNRSRHSSPEFMYVLPGCGLIQPGGHQIITIGAIPTEYTPEHNFNLLMQVNRFEFTKELKVVTVVEKPCVSLESGNSLNFHPTAVGLKTQHTHHIKNLSHLPVQFQWSIPEAEQELISVKPDAGELHPNESSIQTWSFSPLAEKEYTLKPTLNFWAVQSDGSDKLHLTLEVTGMGAKGFIETEKAVLDVGDILVGSCQLIEIPLVNNSPCSVSVHLSVEQKRTDVDPFYDSEEDQSGLYLDCETATIASHFTVSLRSSLRIYTHGQYVWTISYCIPNLNALESSPPQKLCEVRAKGIYPTLQVVDSCSSGSSGRLSKLLLWKLLSLDSLNELLLAAPSPIELTFKTPTKHSVHSSATFSNTQLDFIFSSASLDSDPSEFKLMLHNPGSIPVDWAFLFPKDLKIKLKDWAVTAEFTRAERYQMVQDNQPFQVYPKSGTLLSGQRKAVSFSYSHSVIGTNRLPVVFKLTSGREILLNFQGETVARDEPCFHFSSYRHVFKSVYFADTSPPMQMYELYNGGAVPVHYEVDKAVVTQLKKDNFNHPVLYCLNPEGEVPPGETIKLEWIFSPLQLKRYHIDVPIYIKENNFSVTVKFEGCGIATPTYDFSKVHTWSDSEAAKQCVKREPFPGQVLFLSDDTISIGDTPVSLHKPRIFFLTNVSQTETALFKWEFPQQSNLQVVTIKPDRGRLRPGEDTLCSLMLNPADFPTVYQLDIICQVFSEAALIQYRDTLRCWEEEKERQQNEFMITDKKFSRSSRVWMDENPLPPSREGPSLVKYKPLPPITPKAVGIAGAEETRAERRLRGEKAKVLRPPQRPDPALLHLTVTAQTHRPKDSFLQFPEHFHNYHKNFQPREKQQTVPSASASLSTSTPGPGREICKDILSMILRDLLKDEDFVDSLVTSASKIRPYQYLNEPSTSRPLSTSSPSPQPQVLSDGADRAEAEETRSTRKPKLAPLDLCEAVLLNVFENMMVEIVRGEFDFTADP